MKLTKEEKAIRLKAQKDEYAKQKLTFFGGKWVSTSVRRQELGDRTGRF